MIYLIASLLLSTTPKIESNNCDSCNYKGNVLFVKKAEESSFQNTSVEIGANTINLRIDNCCKKSDSIQIEGQIIFPTVANSNDSSNIKIYYCSLKGSVYKIEKEITNAYQKSFLDIKLKKCSKKFLVVYSDKFNGVVISLNKF
jgi:hypothetical protein